MRKPIKNSGLAKKKYSLKIAGCQQQIKRPTESKPNDEWLKTFYLN